MSRARGLVLQNALARYLTAWFPHAESAGAGRQGSDILGTPGIVWECKTATRFRPEEFCRQASQHADKAAIKYAANKPPIRPLPVTVYFPNGIGERSVASALAMMPISDLICLLGDAGYWVTPEEQARALDEFTSMMEET